MKLTGRIILSDALGQQIQMQTDTVALMRFQTKENTNVPYFTVIIFLENSGNVCILNYVQMLRVHLYSNIRFLPQIINSFSPT